MGDPSRWTWRRLFKVIGMILVVWFVALVVLFITAAVVSVVVSNF